MKIKEQTRKLAAGCSKHHRTDEVSSKHVEVVDRTDEVSSKHHRTDEVSSKHVTGQVSNPTYGRATLTRFEEIFEEYETKRRLVIVPASF
ncbi:chlorohydrolase [Streptococcus pneumoniae]|uniref:hypothetical protein n=1 Tax=Streptococcus pneumoniae TaxID=1313 RepID=UPI0005E027DF|nr:hypothetical protein [Streptococcus pneumoniae]CMX34864.1 chlorohydrolase [Streptococcus pneumoniae]